MPLWCFTWLLLKGGICVPWRTRLAVLVQAAVAMIVFTEAGMGLCVGFVPNLRLIRHRCFGCC